MNKIRLITQLLLLCLMLIQQSFAQAEIKVTYYIPDASGSPVAATDEQGNVKWRKHYKPFGEEIDQGEASRNNHIGYTGHVHDRSTGLTYMGARYYDPIVGRFMGMDPAGVIPNDPRTFNRFAYANNNPYKYVDPDGRNPALAGRLGYAVGRVTVAPGINWGINLIVGSAVTDYTLGTYLYEVFNEVKSDGEGSTQEEIDNSSGGPTAGKPVSKKERDKIIAEEKARNEGELTCWRCGWKSNDESKFDIGHKNIPRSKGGNKHPDNLACEGQSCNRSAGNRGKPKEGSDCKSKNTC